MSKKKFKSNKIEVQESKHEVKIPLDNPNQREQTSEHWYDRMTQGWVPYIIMMLLSLALYANTFNHQFALDDDIVICKNEYVLQGISGIPDIFKKDLFDSFYKQMNTTDQLSGGRYRPLSVASFAIEQEFIGTMESPKYADNCWDFNKNGIADASEDLNGDGIFNDKDCRAKGFGFRHVDNAIFYGIACCILFLFLSVVVFPKNKLLAFIVTLLFLAHPIHTEVVANVKSRDEIFSIIFMLLTLYFSFKYYNSSTLKYLIWSGVMFLCAMLSKEYGATLLILVPLSMYLFGQGSFSMNKTVKIVGTLLVVFGIYYAMRAGAVNVMGKSDIQDTELLNNPFLLADDNQKIATKLFIFLKYIFTLIVPFTLSSDYGYNSIPYRDFSNPEVWLGLLSIIGIIVGGIIALRKKHWIAFALAFYMLNILLVTNLIFNVGATMGERLAFHSSVGFCMLLGGLLMWLVQKLNNKMMAFYIMLPIFLLYSIKTISRNKAWESDISLALTDVITMPESVSLNGNASSRYIDLSEFKNNKPKEKELLDKAIGYGLKATKLHPAFVNGYLNLGLAYAKLEKYDSAKLVWDKAFQIYPNHPNKKLYFDLLASAYYNKGFNLGVEKKWQEGKEFLLKAVELNPSNARYWYDLGGFSYNSGDYAKAKEAWNKAYQLNPNDAEIQKVQNVLR